MRRVSVIDTARGYAPRAGSDLLVPAVVVDDGLVVDLQPAERGGDAAVRRGRIVRDSGTRRSYRTRRGKARGQDRGGKAGRTAPLHRNHEIPLWAGQVDWEVAPPERTESHQLNRTNSPREYS